MIKLSIYNYHITYTVFDTYTVYDIQYLPSSWKLCYRISMKSHIKVPLDQVAVFFSRSHSLDMNPIASNLTKNLKLNYPQPTPPPKPQMKLSLNP